MTRQAHREEQSEASNIHESIKAGAARDDTLEDSSSGEGSDDESEEETSSIRFDSSSDEETDSSDESEDDEAEDNISVSKQANRTKNPVPKAAAAHSFRYHLPTQAEKDHSKALIVEWENQIKSTEKSIWKVDRDLWKEIDAIENDFNARMRKATDEARAAADKKRKPLKSKLGGLKKQVKKERLFLAPIRKLPIEVVTDIITYDLESYNSNYDMQRRWQIATVCRMWRAIILGTATFWKDVDSSKWEFSERSLKRLERRLELSGSIGLNVTLHYYTRKDIEEIQLRHFKALARAGIHRWRSLTVKSSRLESDTESSPLLGIFTGKLSSLHSLVINDDRQRGRQDVFDSLYALIAETAPPLEEFECYRNPLPDGFLETNMFRNLRSLRATPMVVAEIMSKTDAVMEVHTGINYNPAEFKAFDLPHTTTLDGITLTELSECGLDRVHDLTLGSFCHRRDVYRGGDSDDNDIYPSNTTPLHFQNLRIFRLTTYDKRPLRWMLDATAPNLSHLIVGTDVDDARQSTPIIQEIFVKQNKRIHITPTHFELQMILSSASVIQIMDKWSQLVDFSFQCVDKFAWKGFAKSMCKKRNPLCPNLRVLRVKPLYTFRESSQNAWKEAATEILRHRKGVYPLEEIRLDERWSESEELIFSISDV